MNKKTLIVDSSQIQAFLECPQYWAYSYRHNLTPKVSEPKEAMIKGTFGHKLLELYYKADKSLPLVERLSTATTFPFDEETNCECGHAKKSHSVIELKQENKQSEYLSKCSLCSGTPSYLHQFKNAPYPLSQPLRLQIIDRFRSYALVYQHNDIRPHSPDTVEVGFSELIYEDSEHLFVLEGKIDLLGKLNNESLIMDHKFQERSHTLYKKSVQFRNYSLVTGTKLMIINYIRMAKSAEKPFERALVTFTANEHEWWRKELIKIYKSMLSHLESGFTLDTSHNWAHCKGQWGRPCEFTELCEERSNQQLIHIKMKNMYTKKEEWRPW